MPHIPEHDLIQNPDTTGFVAEGQTEQGAGVGPFGDLQGDPIFNLGQPIPDPPFSGTGDTTSIQDTIGGLVNTPSLPPGTEITPELLTPGEDEFLPPATELDTGLGAAPPPPITAPDTETEFDVGGAVGDVSAPGVDVDAESAESIPAQEAATFEASLLSDEQIEAALVSTELAKLLDFEAGDVPKQFQGAILAATAAANARGLGASTIAAEAIAAGLVNAALPIAQGNAQIRLNAMLSNQGAENAALQFNAESTNQVAQFYDSLATQIDQFNVSEENRINLETELAEAQFDIQANIANIQNDLAAATTEAELSAASERLDSELALQASIESAQLIAQTDQFNADLANGREEFNIGNQLIIDQSNAEWRRIINTASTAAINAANATNAANLLNMSNFALANLWQEFRDEAFWAWTAGENETDRAHNLALAAFERSVIFDQLDAAQQSEFYSLVGAFTTNVFDELTK